MAIPVITVGAFEARTHFSSLLKCVERGEEVLITRHGKAIARLIPVAAADRADLRATVGRMKELRAHTTIGGLSWKELRDKGRW